MPPFRTNPLSRTIRPLAHSLIPIVKPSVHITILLFIFITTAVRHKIIQIIGHPTLCHLPHLNGNRPVTALIPDIYHPVAALHILGQTGSRLRLHISPDGIYRYTMIPENRLQDIIGISAIQRLIIRGTHLILPFPDNMGYRLVLALKYPVEICLLRYLHLNSPGMVINVNRIDMRIQISRIIQYFQYDLFRFSIPAQSVNFFPEPILFHNILVRMNVP